MALFKTPLAAFLLLLSTETSFAVNKTAASKICKFSISASKNRNGDVESLRKPGQISKILKADPETTHLDILADFLQKALLDYEKAMLDPSSKLTELELGMSKVSLEFVKKKVSAAISERKVTRVFYEAVAVFLVYSFGRDVAHLPAEIEASFQSSLRNMRQLFRDDALTSISMSIFGKLSFYEIFDLWPQLLPEGVIFSKKIHYDNGYGGGPSFKQHDKNHNFDFVKKYAKLRIDQRRAFVKIVHFFRQIRSSLSEREELILGEIIGEIIHEKYDFDFFHHLFYAEQMESIEGLKDFGQLKTVFRNLRKAKIQQDEVIEVLARTIRGFRKETAL